MPPPEGWSWRGVVMILVAGVSHDSIVVVAAAVGIEDKKSSQYGTFPSHQNWMCRWEGNESPRSD